MSIPFSNKDKFDFTSTPAAENLHILFGVFLQFQIGVDKQDCYVDYFEDGELLPNAETMAEFRRLEAEMSEKWTDAPSLPKAI